MVELDNFFINNGIVDPFIVGQHIDVAVKKYQDNAKLFPKININEMLESFEIWNIETVMSHLNRNINESLTAYKNV